MRLTSIDNKDIESKYSSNSGAQSEYRNNKIKLDSWTQRLINLEVAVFARSLKSSLVTIWMVDCSSVVYGYCCQPQGTSASNQSLPGVDDVELVIVLNTVLNLNLCPLNSEKQQKKRKLGHLTVDLIHLVWLKS